MYFQALVNEYRMVETALKNQSPQVVQVIDELIADVRGGKKVTSEDLCTFDTALLVFLDKERLVCKLPVVCDMYREIAGEKNLANRLRIKPADSAGATDIMLRAQIRELLNDLYLHLKLYAGCRRSRNAVLFRMLVPMTALFLGFIAWMELAKGEIQPIVYVIVSGSIGGLISTIRRVQDTTGSDTHALTFLDLKLNRLTIYLAPCYGAVFSVILLLFFTSHMLTGDIFPSIETMDTDLAEQADTVAEVMRNFVSNTYPATGGDCAKLIIWSFIAGFAEKFVPDTLDRLAARGQKTAAPAAKPNGSTSAK
jgi:hypothetical protein